MSSTVKAAPATGATTKKGKAAPAVQTSAPAADAPSAAATAQAVHRYVHLDEIAPDRHNVRGDLGDLTELVESIRAKGVLQPLLARPHAGHGLDLVCGHRRLAAARAAGLTEVPVVVRDMSDQEALEAQLTENLQRADVHPLDEAEGYARLSDEFHLDGDAIAAKVGKSKAYVYARMKLCSLAKGPREKFRAGKLTASVALLLARIPAAKDQEEATRLVIDDQHGREPLSTSQAFNVIQREFMLSLKRAPFDPKDATLVPKAGACATCPKLSGNAKLLFPDVRDSDVCTDSTCWRSKVDADFERVAKSVKAAGGKVLAKSAADTLFPDGFRAGEIPQVAGDRFVVLKAAPTAGPYRQAPEGMPKGTTWGGLIAKAEVARASAAAKKGEAAPDPVKITLARAPDGSPIELVEIGDAIDAARDATDAEWTQQLRKPTAPRTAKPVDPKEQARRQKERERKVEAELAADDARINTIVAAAEKIALDGLTGKVSKLSELLTEVALLAHAARSFSCESICRRRGWKVTGGWDAEHARVRAAIKRGASPVAVGLLVELLIDQLDDNGDEGEALAAFVKAVGAKLPDPAAAAASDDADAKAGKGGKGGAK